MPGSVERRHQNISAILIELGLPWIDGYKPLSNYQDLLFHVVEQQVERDQILLALIGRDAESAALPPKSDSSEDLVAALEDPPAGVARAPYPDRVRERNVTPPRLNYPEPEAGNFRSGEASKGWVVGLSPAVDRS